MVGTLESKMPDMSAYPDWFWLCQARERPGDDTPMKCLIIQDRTGQSLTSDVVVKEIEKAEGDILYDINVDGSFYQVLGTFIWDESALPDLSRLCAIDSNLLIPASATTPVFRLDKAILMHVEPVSVFWGLGYYNFTKRALADCKCCPG